MNQFNMATESTFYLDAPSLESASVVFANADLTVLAADGFYSDGFIVREQVSGVLLPQQTCQACATPCGGTINGSGQQGIYYLTTELGPNVGAIVIRFNPFSVPDGIVATYNGNIYNGVSSPNFGWLQGDAGLATYIGDTSADCGIVASSPIILDEFEYNGTAFASLGTTTTVTIVSGQMQLTAGSPGNTVMVIPKTLASPSILDLSFIGPCSGTVFNISVSCPAVLLSFASSTIHSSSAVACEDTVDQTYYVALVNGTSLGLGLYDLVFSDPNGEFKLGEGFYKTTFAGSNTFFQVDTNGVIIAFGVCPTPPPAESYNCVSGNCVDPGDGTGQYATLVDCEANCGEPPTPINAIAVFGYMEPCSGGTIDDFMGATVVLDAAADVDSAFVVDVFYVETGGTCGGTQFTQTFNVNILAGQTTSNFNACTEGAFFPNGAVICGDCIASCDNPAINISSFACPV